MKPFVGSAWICLGQQLALLAHSVTRSAQCRLYLTTAALLVYVCLQKHDDQQLADELYAEHGRLGFTRDFFVKVRHSYCYCST
jgi:hypothetical protein